MRVGRYELIDPDDYALLGLDFLLVPVGGLLDFPLLESLLDRRYGAAERIYLLDVLCCFLLDRVGEMLDEIGAAQWVNGIGHAALVADNLLCA